MGALGVAAGGKPGPDGERIALVIPVTVVVAGARVLVEVAVLPARGVVLTRDPAIVGGLGVVAGAEAVGIVRVDQPVPVVVEQIPTLIDVVLALRGDERATGGTAARGGGPIHADENIVAAGGRDEQQRQRPDEGSRRGAVDRRVPAGAQGTPTFGRCADPGYVLLNSSARCLASDASPSRRSASIAMTSRSWVSAPLG